MNLKAIVASLVLASSSAAMAAPAVTVTAKASLGFSTAPAAPAVIVRDHREPAQPAPIVRDHRDQRWNEHPIIQQPVRYQPIVYQPYQPYQPRLPRYSVVESGVKFGTDGRAWIHMMDDGAFRTLKLSTQERTLVREVAIEFADKSTQVLRNLNQVVDAAHPLTIDLNGDLRTIKTVVVYGPKGLSPAAAGCNEITVSAAR